MARDWFPNISHEDILAKPILPRLTQYCSCILAAQDAAKKIPSLIYFANEEPICQYWPILDQAWANISFQPGYVHDQSIEEDLLFCSPLETTTQAADVMQLVDAFFEEEGLDWGKLVHACTDGAPAMLGARSGFAKLLKQKNPKAVTLHCIIHREALASRTMTQPLKEALETAIGVVNFVKASALNTRLFRRLYQNMESDYEGLLFHTTVRWLSKGDMLNRLVHLLPEVTQFLEERNKRDLKAAVSDEAFQCRLAFLADMFSHLNMLTASYRAWTPI